jgi:hypothetical protein
MMTRLIRIAVFVLPLITIVMAQPSFPEGPDQAPIGGLELLAAAGGALALKKLRDKKKNKSS